MSYKTWLHTAIVVAATFLLLEVSTALALFHLGHIRKWDRFVIDYSEGSTATSQFFRKIVKKLGAQNPDKIADVTISSDPKPLFVFDEKLGYSIAPGVHAIEIRQNSEKNPLAREFTATIRQDHSRATSYRTRCADQQIHLFGDSQIWGWGNNDEQTMPWLLQARYPNYQVINHAQVGYGNVQSLIQLQEIKGELSDNDVFVIAYAEYMNMRNVAAPTFLRSIDVSEWAENYSDRASFPFGAIERGELVVRRVGMECTTNKGWCDKPDPAVEDMHAVTRAILGRLFDVPEARGALLFLTGNDDDPVVASARQQQIPVIDARSRKGYLELDTFMPLDGHGGPITQYLYFARLREFLEKSNWVSRQAQGVQRDCSPAPTNVRTESGKAG